MFLIITIIIAIVGLLFKSNKFFFKLQFFWLWLLIAFNNDNIDYKNYLEIFEMNSKIWKFNFQNSGNIYGFGCYIFSKLNLSYIEYNFFLMTVAIWLLYCFIKRYSLNNCYVTSLLMFYPFVDCIIQSRNFLVIVLLLHALTLLMYKPSKYKTKFVFYVYFMYGFHAVGIVYLILLFIPFISLKVIKRISYFGVLISLSCVGFLPKIARFLFPSKLSKIEVYLNYNQTNISISAIIFFCLIHLMMFWFISSSYKNIVHKDRISDVIVKINYLCLVFISLYFYESTFFRVYRNIYILNYLYFGNYIVREKKLVMNVLFVLYIISLSLLYVVNSGYLQILVPIFTKNFIFNVF